MGEWIYFIHAAREDFAATMTDEERLVWDEHAELLQRRLNDGSSILASRHLVPSTPVSVCSKRPTRKRREGTWNWIRPSPVESPRESCDRSWLRLSEEDRRRRRSRRAAITYGRPALASDCNHADRDDQLSERLAAATVADPNRPRRRPHVAEVTIPLPSQSG